MKTLGMLACLILMSSCSLTRALWQQEIEEDRLQAMRPLGDGSTVVMAGCRADYLTTITTDWAPLLAAGLDAALVLEFEAERSGDELRFQVLWSDEGMTGYERLSGRAMVVRRPPIANDATRSVPMRIRSVDSLPVICLKVLATPVTAVADAVGYTVVVASSVVWIPPLACAYSGW